MPDTTPDPPSRPPLDVHPVSETDPRIDETPPGLDFGIRNIDVDQYGRFQVPKPDADYCLLEQAKSEAFLGLGMDEPRPIDWLWPGRIPIGKLTLIEGQSNSGTSFLAADLAARVSSGIPRPAASGRPGPQQPGPQQPGPQQPGPQQPGPQQPGPQQPGPQQPGPQQPGHAVLGSAPPDNCQQTTDNRPPDNCPPEAGHVMFVSDGDNLHDTLTPRLINMQANPYNFTILSRVSVHDPAEMRAGKADTERRLCLPADLGHIEYQLRLSPHTRLLVVDSLSDFCTTDKQFRETLRGLHEIAERCHVAVVATARPKNFHSARNKLKPSADRRAESVRCVLNVLVDPHDPSQRYLAPARMNFCREPQWMPFRIGEGKIDWGEPLKTAPNYQRFSEAAREKVTLLKEAMVCLNETLAGGDMLTKLAIREVMECGFSKGTILRARRELGVESIRKGFGLHGRWYWTLKKAGELMAEAMENGAPENVKGDNGNRDEREASPIKPSTSGRARKKPAEVDEFAEVDVDRMSRAQVLEVLNQSSALEKAAMARALLNGKPESNGKPGKNGRIKPR